jgi:glycosyltransferase involved in cell wall biosynthesis
MKPVLAHVITGLNTGGAEMMLANILAHHQQSHFRPVVYCLAEQGPIADRIRALGVPVHSLDMRSGLPDPRAIRRLARALREEQAVVAQTWLYHADLIGGLAARMAGIPVVWGIHNSTLHGNASSRGLRMVIRVCRWLSPVVPSAIVCVAESAKAAHVAMGYPARKMTVIPNGFDLTRFRPNPDARRRIRAELAIDPDAPVILIAGRFAPLKNHRMFVAAAEIVANRYPETHFVMVGDGLGATNRELTEWVEQTGHPTRFHLLGRQSDMPELLAAADLIALTSNTEAFPLVIGEAMASGVPCVCTDVGDARSLIGDTGRIVPVGATAAFADAIGELLAMPPAKRHALGCRARAKMEAEYDLGRIAARYDQLWQSLESRGKPCA